MYSFRIRDKIQNGILRNYFFNYIVIYNFMKNIKKSNEKNKA